MRAHNIDDKGINVGRSYSIKKAFGRPFPYPFAARLEKRGLTLIETMLATAVFLILFGAMVIVMLKCVDAFYIGDGHVYLEEEGSKAIDEISRVLGESNVSAVSMPFVSDPLTGGSYPMLMVPTGRGDPQAAPPNDNFSVSSQMPTFGEPDWQSVVIYYPYQSQDIAQLRQYVIYDSDFSKGFPFSSSGISDGQITISNYAGETRSVQRDSGRVVTNHFNLNGNYQIKNLANLVIIDLPLRKQISRIGRGGADLFLDSNIKSAVTLKSRELDV